MNDDKKQLEEKNRLISQLTFEVGCLKADIERLRLKVSSRDNSMTAAAEILNKRID